MKKITKNKGMTMAEMLLVVAIIAVLGGVAFVSIIYYQRSMGQLERDGIAKEIFVAAQNHLTMAKGTGYLGLNPAKYGIKEKDADDKDSTYYIVVNSGSPTSTNAADIFNLMLPFGSIEETVRAGSSYVIRYDIKAGLIKDVFYCTLHDSPRAFNHTIDASEYETLLELASVDKKQDRRTYKGVSGNESSVLGWYGGAEASSLETTELQSPSIIVFNQEKLYLRVTDPNENKASLNLVILGESSGAKKMITLIDKNGIKTPGGLETNRFMNKSKEPGSSYEYCVILDDITIQGLHFSQLVADSGSFIPGEDLRIQAVAYNNEKLSNIAYSAEVIRNSLFWDLSDIPSDDPNTTVENGRIEIKNIRHLENLDKTVSGFIPSKAGSISSLNVKEAVQSANMSWNTFKSSNVTINQTTGLASGDLADPAKTRVYDSAGSTVLASDGCYYPISPDYILSYDGLYYDQVHSISDIKVAHDSDAGLFGQINQVPGGLTSLSVSNLKLIDFNITTTKRSAGALAGMINSGEIKNVVAYETGTDPLHLIESKEGAAGGLIGTMLNGKVEYSAAALLVQGTTAAGGLIGESSFGTVDGCHSGGHTDSTGNYDKENCNVKGNISGGLIGIANGTDISFSYSTCSVAANDSEGTCAGGFVGTFGTETSTVDGKDVVKGAIHHCYSTGYIGGDTARKGSFAGNLTCVVDKVAENNYFEIINEVVPNETEKNFTFLPPVGNDTTSVFVNNIKPFDTDASSYDAFVGGVGAKDERNYLSGWQVAYPYDDSLKKYYSGKYNLKTAFQLMKDGNDKYTVSDEQKKYLVTDHYGDWPAPEIFVINQSGS